MVGRLVSYWVSAYLQGLLPVSFREGDTGPSLTPSRTHGQQKIHRKRVPFLWKPPWIPRCNFQKNIRSYHNFKCCRYIIYIIYIIYIYYIYIIYIYYIDCIRVEEHPFVSQQQLHLKIDCAWENKDLSHWSSLFFGGWLYQRSKNKFMRTKCQNYVDCHFVQMFGLPVPAFLEKPILVEIR